MAKLPPGRTPERQRVIDYVAQFGLDATEISQDDHDAEGFWLVRGERTWHRWPEELDYDWLTKLLHVAWLSDFRYAGIHVRSVKT